MDDSPATDRFPQAPQVPGYDSFELIGRGGFSTVWKARQVAYDRLVAVKILNTGFDDEAGQRRFQRECALTGRLTGHPNIVTVLDSGFLADGHPFLTMDYCPNGSLADRIAREGPLSSEEVSRVGVKIAGALHTAHQRGVIHRDVKPENILITAFGEPALADFGISTSTTAGTVTAAYTPTHAAPEVLLGETADVRTDIYTLGSTLYQLLAGTPAFVQTERGGLARFVQEVLNTPPPSLEGVTVPEPIRRVIEASMAKDPAARPASAEAFGRMMQDAQRASGMPITEMLVAAAPTVDLPTEPMLPPTPATAAHDTRLSSRRSGRQETAPDAQWAHGQATILPPSYRGGTPAAPVGDSTVLGGRGDRPLPDADFRQPQEPNRRRRWPLVLVAIIAFAVVGGLAGLFATGAGQEMLGRFGIGTPVEPAIVPDETPSPDVSEAEWPPEDELLPPEDEVAPPGDSPQDPPLSTWTPIPTPSKTTHPPISITTGPGVSLPTKITPKPPKITFEPIQTKPQLKPPAFAIQPVAKATTIQDAQYLYVLWNDSPSTSVTQYQLLLLPTKQAYATILKTDNYTCGQPYDHCFRVPLPATGTRCFEIVAITDSGNRSQSNPQVCSKPV